MITLTTSGNTIYFQFEDNPHYLQNGVIEAPKNSLILVTDDSQMATFKKVDGDVFISALYSELGMTKAELETWFEENATTDYGGGGGGGGVTSGEVETMINDALTDYYDIDEVDAAISAATDDMATQTWVGNQGYITGVDLSDYATLQDVDEAVSGKVDSSSLATVATSGDYDDLLNKPTIPTVPTDVSAFNNDAGYITEDAISGKAATSAVTAVNDVLTGHTADTSIHVTSSDKSTWSGKQDALVSGTNIKTINNQSLLGSGNITISGGSGSGTAAVEVTQAQYDSMVSGGTVDPTVFYIITDATPVDLSGFVQTSAITSAVTSASTDSQIPTAKAVYDAIPTGGTGGGVNVVQTTGTSTTDVMSQNAVTSSLKNKGDNLMWDQISSPINYAELRLRSDSVTLSSAKLNLGDYLVYGSPVANALNITGLTSESAFTTYTASTNSRLSEDEEVTAAALNALNDNFGGLKLVKLTQQEYDDLAVKNNNTLYVII